ncbi:MAG: hypothetical protein HYZ53_05260 [Planctomycetes bacterium]|nr:hypothetical protein [Planctomycetota bacterium]
MSRFDPLHELRPENVRKLLARSSKSCLLSVRDVLARLRGHPCLLPVFNVGCRHVLPGILRAAAELDALVGIAASPDEAGVDGGTTGQTPRELANGLLEFSERNDFVHPIVLHADAVPVSDTTPAEIDAARKNLDAMLHAGFTSFGIHVSPRPIAETTRWCAELARPLQDAGLGLEVALHPEEASVAAAPAEAALELVRGLAAAKAPPDLVAFQEPGPGGARRDAAREVADALAPFSIGLARSLAEGTDPRRASSWAGEGVRKLGVPGLWRRLLLENLPPPLLQTMRERAGGGDGACVLRAMKTLKRELDNIPEKFKRAIEQRAFEEALALLRAIDAAGSAQVLLERFLRGGK